MPLMRLFALGAAFSAATLVSAGAAPRPPAPAAAPEVRVQGYRIVVERLQQVENVALDFTQAPVAKPAGQQVVSVGLAVYPPAPKLVANIEGLDPKVIAFLNGSKAVSLGTYSADDANPLATGVWRTVVIGQDLDFTASRLSRLQGELIVYPNAGVVTLDFPLDGKPGRTVEKDGLRATLKKTTLRPGTVTVSLLAEWDSALRVTRADPESPYGIVAVTKAGVPVLPNGGGFGNTSKRGTVSVRDYTVSFTDMREPPALIRMQMMVRSGVPRKLPFIFGDLLLPDRLPTGPEAGGDGPSIGILAAGHPLYAPAGGSVRVPVRRGTAGEPGSVLVGLSRKDASGWGPWRWLEAQLDSSGEAVLAKIRPGTYRLARSWMPGSNSTELPASAVTASHAGGVVELEIAAGKTVAVPLLDTGGRP